MAQSTSGSFFHTTLWRSAVRNAFGHPDLTLVARRGRDIVGGLPLMLVRSRLAGKLLISVPYAVYGGALGDDAGALEALRRKTTQLTEDLGARSVDLRSTRVVWPSLPTVNRYATFRKRLPRPESQCLPALPRKARAAARIARDRHRLEHVVGHEHLPSAWRLYARTMSRLGSIAYPFRFVRLLLEHAPPDSFVSLLLHAETPVAGLVTWVYNGSAMPYFVGVHAGFAKMNAHNYVYLCAMERAVRLGCHTFDFGRSRLDNHGAIAFKRHQGFAAEPLGYQSYTPPGHTPPDLSPSSRRFAMARRIWPALPACITTPLGGWLSKHIPG